MSKLGKWAFVVIFAFALIGLCPGTAWAESVDEDVIDAQMVGEGDIVVGDGVTATFDKETGTVTFYSDGGTLWSDWVDKSGIVWVGIEKIRVAEGGKVFLPIYSANLFKGLKYLSAIDMRGFDSSNVNNMSSMFQDCNRLTTLDLSGFETSKLLYVREMFSGCKGLTYLNLSGWEFSKVEQMGEWFSGCTELATLELNGVNTSGMTSMESMFSGLRGLKALDLSSFDTSNVKSMRLMFNNCESLTSLDLSRFDTSKVTDMTSMFRDCSSLTSLDLSSFNTAHVTSMCYMFSSCLNLTRLELSSFDTTYVTDMSCMFIACASLPSLDLRNFNTSHVTSMDGMFNGCSSLISLELNGLNTSSVSDMNNMFYRCRSLTALDLSGLDTSNVQSMDSMFYECDSLSNLSLSGLNFSALTNMKSMFSGCSSLTTLNLSGLDFPVLTCMSHMFAYCKSLTTLNLSGIDTPELRQMEYMFRGCSSLVTFDFGEIDTSKVTDMESMFYGCSSLNSLDLSGIDISNVSNMRSMFYDCSSLNTLDLSVFDTSNVGYRYMDYMFYGCDSLTSLDFSKFNTSKVTGMNYMFYRCISLNNLNLSGFDTSNVDSMRSMFYGCSSLNDLNLSGFDTSNVDSMSSMFYGCSSLNTLDLSGFDMTNVQFVDKMLRNCYNLKILKTPKLMNTEYQAIELPCAMYDIEGQGYNDFSKASGSIILAVSQELAGETTYPVEGVLLDKEEITIKRGESSILNAKIVPETAFNKIVLWSSSDESVATIDESGNITTLKIGTTDITAVTADGGFTSTCKLTVIAPDVSGITISQDSLTIKRGETNILNATVEPYDAENKAVVWSSSDESVATVDENGTITTLKIGTADIVATTVDGGLTATCNLTVVAPNVTGITLSQEALTVKRGETATLSATVEPFDAENKSVTWNSSDKTVATVNKSGNITTLKVGTTVISATTVDGGFTATCNLTVTAPDVSGVNLSQNEMTLKRGETATLTATVEPYDAENKSVIWSSSDETVAAVDENGRISTLKIGETDISVTTADGNFVAVCKLKVIAPEVSSIVLESYDLVLKRGEVKTLSAVLEPYDAEGTIIWESDDENVATIDENGTISALSVGFADISATLDEAGLVEHCYLTVVAPDISGISINPQTITLKRGEMGVLNAEVEPYDAEPRSVIWTSSDENVATVDESGIITTLMIGTTDITAATEDGGFTAVCKVTVEAPNVSGITLDKETLTLKRGETGNLSAAVEPYDAENKSVTWTTSDETVAVVDESGIITSLKVGTADITATTLNGGFTATCTLTVTAPDAAGINLDKESASINTGKTLQITASVEPADANQGVIWSSSDNSVATVDQNGLVTAIKEGSATITASAENGLTAVCDVTVKKNVIFTDVADPTAWYYNSVYWAVENGVTSGMGEGTFQPMAKLSRAQAVTFLYNLAGRPDVTGLQTKEFTDVVDTAWYYKAVKWAVAKGITSGYGTGTFQPNATCNRAMIVTFLMNYAKAVGTYKEPTISSSFKDVAATAWYKVSVDWAVENGITSGYGQGTFSPNVTCNRAMMVTFLKKVSELPVI